MTDLFPFFVYGTLLPNQPNFYYWGNAIVAMETAVFANGCLVNLGNYPMLIEAQDHAVTGMVITLDPIPYQTILSKLDQLEGYDPAQPNQSGYVRVTREVHLRNGRSQTAWVYIGQHQFLPSMPIIKNGDWAAYSAHKQEEVNEWWQSANYSPQLHKTPDKS